MEEKQLNNFYEFCSTTCGEKRIYKIKNTLKNVKKFLKKDLTKLTISDVIKYLAYLNNSNYSLHTKNDSKKIFKRFLKIQYKNKIDLDDLRLKEAFKLVSDDLLRNKDKINKNTLIKADELEALIRIANNLKWKALISLMYEGALRPCEVRILKWKDLMFDESINICRVHIISPKTKKERTIPVRDCILHLKRWREEYSFIDRGGEDYVFPSQHHKEKLMGDGVITQMFKRLSAKAKLRHIFPYLLRHGRLYDIQKTLPEKLSCKFGGHSSRASEFYNNLDDDDVEESMLKDFYPTKELTLEQKNKYDEQIENLKKQNKIRDKFLKVLLKKQGITEKDFEDLDVKQQVANLS